MAGLLKCPPFCKSSCKIKHHPLLLAIVNCIDTDKNQEMMESLLQDLQDCINKFTKDGKWKKKDNIPDANEAYQFPMIHWACALGRVFAVLWLIQEDFSPVLQTVEGDTGLHRAIYCLQESCPKEALQKFQKLVPLLEKSLFVKNKSGNTPLHTCCELLLKEVPKVEFHYGCLAAIIGHGKRKGERFLKTMLSSQNASGDTPLHILSRHDRNINGIKLLVEAGAPTDIENSKGFKPIDVAIDCGQLKLSKYFQDLRIIKRKVLKQSHFGPTEEVTQSSVGGGGSADKPHQSPRRSQDLPLVSLLDIAKMSGAGVTSNKRFSSSTAANTISHEPDPKKAKTNTTLLWTVNLAEQPPEEKNSATGNIHSSVPSAAKAKGTATATTSAPTAGKKTELSTANERNILSYFKHSTPESRTLLRKTMERDRDIHQRDLHDMDIEKKKLTNGLATTIEEKQEVSAQIQKKLKEMQQLQKREMELKTSIQTIHNRMDSISQRSLKAQEQFRACQHALDAFDKL